MPTFNLSIVEIIQYDAVIAFLASLAVCLLLISTKKWHGAFSMDSSTGVQKVHINPTPRIGGIAILIGVFAGFVTSSHGVDATEKRAIISAILLAGMPAFIFGLLEDVTKKVSVKIRLLATMVSGIIGWGITGTALTHLDLPIIDFFLAYTVISVLFTAFAISGLANAINIIDGFNGLAAGTVFIMLAAFGLVARQAGDLPLAFTCLLVSGALGGFFLVNWPNGKIFLGDGGAYFLGFTLAWIAVLLPERNSTISPWTSLLICSYPIIEVVFSIFRRRVWREGCHATQPDAVHLHTLANKRWVRKIFPNATKTIQNGFTSPFLWAYALISSITAVWFYQSKLFTFISLTFCFVLYVSMYSKLAFFRWIPKK